jgi:hypothetical protein
LLLHLQVQENQMQKQFIEFPCSSIRLGSYNLSGSSFIVQVSSTEVLLESASNNQQSQSNVGAFKFDLHFPVKELLEFASHFHPTHPVLFLTFSPELSQNVSNLLNLDQNGPYWNSKSTKETEKRMTLIPHTLDASAIKEIVSLLCKNCRINELKVAEATQLLQISIPSSDEQKYLDAFNRAMKSIRVSSSTIHKINEVRVF